MSDKITLKNINLAKVSISTEIAKKAEEDKEFNEALLELLYDPNKFTYEHVKEEAADVIQTVISLLKMVNVDIVEFATYWNNEHLKKLEHRPR